MRRGHYFDPEPGATSRPSTVALTLPDLTVELVTDRGVFSTDRIDPGTKLLLLEAPHPPRPAGHVLDLGCGYGPIALTLAHRVPASRVWAVDVNQRALDLCRENAERLRLANVEVAKPDEVPADIRFDAIYSNPPIRVGKRALHELLAGWLGRLDTSGRAWLVVHRHLGSDSLARWLADEGWAVRRLASRQGYRILQVTTRALGEPSP